MPDTRQTDDQIARELELLTRVQEAYERARREVFDRVEEAAPQAAALTPHQRRVLAQLEAAEAELALFRQRRRTHRNGAVSRGARQP